MGGGAEEGREGRGREGRGREGRGAEEGEGINGEECVEDGKTETGTHT